MSGYLGCFELDAAGNQTLVSPVMTVAMCKEHCRMLNMHFACLHHGNSCSCESEAEGGVFALSGWINSSWCSERCSGNDMQICGGVGMTSVFNIGQYRDNVQNFKYYETEPLQYRI